MDNNLLSQRALNNAPDSNSQLAKKARKLLTKVPKSKYKMKVFRESGKEFCELQAATKGKLENSKHSFTMAHPSIILSFGEIKPIKIK